MARMTRLRQSSRVWFPSTWWAQKGNTQLGRENNNCSGILGHKNEDGERTAVSKPGLSLYNNKTALVDRQYRLDRVATATSSQFVARFSAGKAWAVLAPCSPAATRGLVVAGNRTWHSTTHCDEFLWKSMASHSTTHVPHSTILLSTRNP